MVPFEVLERVPLWFRVFRAAILPKRLPHRPPEQVEPSPERQTPVELMRYVTPYAPLALAAGGEVF